MSGKWRVNILGLRLGGTATRLGAGLVALFVVASIINITCALLAIHWLANSLISGHFGWWHSLVALWLLVALFGDGHNPKES